MTIKNKIIKSRFTAEGLFTVIILHRGYYIEVYEKHCTLLCMNEFYGIPVIDDPIKIKESLIEVLDEIIENQPSLYERWLNGCDDEESESYPITIHSKKDYRDSL